MPTPGHRRKLPPAPPIGLNLGEWSSTSRRSSHRRMPPPSPADGHSVGGEHHQPSECIMRTVLSRHHHSEIFAKSMGVSEKRRKENEDEQEKEDDQIDGVDARRTEETLHCSITGIPFFSLFVSLRGEKKQEAPGSGPPHHWCGYGAGNDQSSHPFDGIVAHLDGSDCTSHRMEEVNRTPGCGLLSAAVDSVISALSRTSTTIGRAGD
ncbi:Os03g0614500 [Oryza sativa Japonica Group]|jgi:hypothetical protein|uniref:Os03g0614500 protein n=3 Tax=Oryza sativa subsp. japonica TaxID=39947 RepID=A0A0P0W0U0_ORYSJ|nr:Os03g0614500 [Oryza sativa Japonica Group]